MPNLDLIMSMHVMSHAAPISALACELVAACLWVLALCFAHF